MQDLIKYASECLTIAQKIAPKDTGNLAYNAIKVKPIQNGFAIVYVIDIADYIIYNQESNKNKGFIDTTATAIAGYVAGKVTGNQNNSNTLNGSVSQLDNPARQKAMLNSLNRNLKRV